MRLQELMMILFSFSTVTTSVMQLGEHEWLMYLSIKKRRLGALTSTQTQINTINEAGDVSGQLTWPVLQ